VLFALTACASPASSPKVPAQSPTPTQQAPTPPKTTPPPTSSSTNPILRLTDLAKDSQYWNTSWNADELYQTLRSVNKSYHEKHIYIEGVFACANMAVDIWNILDKQGITSAIIVGNLDLDKESFAECNHAWILIIHKDVDSGFIILIMETTNGETYFFDPKTLAFAQYLQGYYFLTPSDLRAYTKGRW
jgi:hypothetical protein